MKDPNPQLWTLRFKQHKVTILLFVEQTESFTSIKAEILQVLKERGLTELNGQPIPSDPEDIILAVLVDKNDPSKGWVGLDIPAMEIEDETRPKKKIGGKKSVLNANPLGAGLKDGTMLAFKFRKDHAKVDDDGLDIDDNGWDVIIPSYEEESTSQR